MKRVKQAILGFAVLALLSIGVLMIAGTITNDANAAQPHRGGVVVLVSPPEVSISPTDLVVVFSSSSQSAPSIARNASLAETLDVLLASGFQIQDIKDTSIGVHYTLVR